MMAILQELQQLGKTIIISSHILSELETLCNRVAIIERGKLIYTGAVQGVRDQMSTGRIFWVKILGEAEPAADLLRQRREVSEVEILEGRLKVMLDDHETDPGCVAETLVRGGVTLIGLEEEELGLEEVFLRVTRGETQ
jgi:ABC-2 type transport system ATP-binding protein